MVYSFGCSFTAGQCNETVLPINFTSLLAKHYNMGFKNSGIIGADNRDTLEHLAGQMLEFKQGDIVIIGLSGPERISAPSNYGDFSPQPIKDLHFSKEVYNEKHPIYSSKKYIHGYPVLAENIADHLVRQFTHVKHIFPGHKSTRDFIESLLPPLVLYMDAFRPFVDEHYARLFYNLGLKLNKKGIKVVIWNYGAWRVIGEYGDNTQCDCGHWSKEGHSLFFNLLLFELNKSKDIVFLDHKKTLEEYLQNSKLV